MTDIYKAPEAELQEHVQTGEYGSLESALAGNFRITPIETMKKAWGMLKGMKTTFWLAMLVYIVIAIVVEVILGFLFGYSLTSQDYNPMEIVGSIISTLILGPVAAGLYMIAIKYSVGAPIEVGEIFKHFHKTIPIFVTTIVMYLAIGLGLILLIVPGIYLLVCFSFALYLVVEKDMGTMQALSTSRKVVHHQWFQMGGLILLSIVVCLLGALALLVGLLWAVPLVGLTFSLVYRDVFGVEEKTLKS